MDVGRPESITQAFERVEREHGRCDILVNCAGIAKVFPFIDFPLDNFVATMNVNVTGTLLCAQAAARLMLRRRWGAASTSRRSPACARSAADAPPTARPRAR